MIKVGIVGGTGYTGVELLRLLAAHPQVSLEVITSRADAGTQVSQMFPSMRGYVDLPFTHPDHAHLEQCDLVFFATPSGVACCGVSLGSLSATCSVESSSSSTCTGGRVSDR